MPTLGESSSLNPTEMTEKERIAKLEKENQRLFDMVWELRSLLKTHTHGKHGETLIRIDYKNH